MRGPLLPLPRLPRTSHLGTAISADSAVALEAQIKSDAGTPVKPVAQIRRDADAAFAKKRFPKPA